MDSHLQFQWAIAQDVTYTLKYDKIEPKDVVNYQTAKTKYRLPSFLEKLPFVADVQEKWINKAKKEEVKLRSQIALIRKYFF